MMASPTGNGRTLAAGPRPARASAAGERRFRHWLRDTEAAGEPALAASLMPHAGVLACLAEEAPFLWRLFLRQPQAAARWLANPDGAFAASLARLDHAAEPVPTLAASMTLLRQVRGEMALGIALADLATLWDVTTVTERLSDFADVAVRHALAAALRESIRLGRLLPPPAPESLSTFTGLVVIAFGKHGARELNYSSDIDLAVFFEPRPGAIPAGRDAVETFVGVVKLVVRLLSEVTTDGYVFRVDLRLRPDPGSTAIALPVSAALAYYETVGQNWERAALIKARPVAGDVAVGAAMLRDLQPFIWRKYFDYAAIADIHAMKRQIRSHRGHCEIAVEGHDVKLGRGGIREIEFFVQTQQLVFGGRRPALRGARTLDMLAMLERDGWITRRAVRDLSAAYGHLRAIEHRLQMRHDEQTQRLPRNPREVDGIARLMGDRPAAFRQRLIAHLRRVEAHDDRLFAKAPALAAPAGSLVFTGVADDPDTLATLRRLGFREPAMVAETVRGWHFGRRPAMTAPRAREALTELVPLLLDALGKASDPDGALRAFDGALQRMPAVAELFTILRANAALRGLFAEIFGSAPRLSEIVSARPHVLDAVIDPDFARPASPDELDRRLGARLAQARGLEEFLDSSRELVRAEHFLIGARLLSGVLDGLECGPAVTAVADAVLHASHERVQRDMAERFGRVPMASSLVIGLGKLGGREMTLSSDLDLVVLYNVPADGAMSDGERPLHASEWYARLTQRLISALTVPTPRGTLYEVDMRLRPSGNKGPLAVSLAAFQAYHAREAETWEKMALTRARVVAGDAGLARRFERARAAVLRRQRDPARVAAEIRAMRGLVAAEKPAAGPFDLKLAAGGFVDIEFIAQYLQLVHARQHAALLEQNTGEVLARLAAAGILSPAAGTALREAWQLESTLAAWLTLMEAKGSTAGALPPPLRARLVAAAHLPDGRLLERHLMEVQGRVRDLFGEIIGTPD